MKCYSGLLPCGWRGYVKLFLRKSEITFLHFNLASCENELLILTFSNSKYSELKRKIKITGQTWDRKILQFWRALHIEFPSTRFSNCYGVLTFFYFYLGNFIFNLVFPAIFITQFAHSCFPFSFVVEALSAKVMYRTGRSAARPTATEAPHCGRRPECDCRWPGPGTGRRWAELSLSAQQPMGIERAVAVHQGKVGVSITSQWQVPLILIFFKRSY